MPQSGGLPSRHRLPGLNPDIDRVHLSTEARHGIGHDALKPTDQEQDVVGRKVEAHRMKQSRSTNIAAID
jgi:hypothetical protein